MKTISSNIIRQVFVLVIILVMGGLIFRELLPYFSGVLGAITIYVILRGWMLKLVRKGWKTMASRRPALFNLLCGYFTTGFGSITSFGKQNWKRGSKFRKSGACL